MSKEKYVKLKDVEELLSLINIRDMFHDWTDDFEKYNEKVKIETEVLKRMAIEIE